MHTHTNTFIQDCCAQDAAMCVFSYPIKWYDKKNKDRQKNLFKNDLIFVSIEPVLRGIVAATTAPFSLYRYLLCQYIENVFKFQASHTTRNIQAQILNTFLYKRWIVESAICVWNVSEYLLVYMYIRSIFDGLEQKWQTSVYRRDGAIKTLVLQRARQMRKLSRIVFFLYAPLRLFIIHISMSLYTVINGLVETYIYIYI